MIRLGLDQALSKTGFALMDEKTLKVSGLILTKPNMSVEQRLKCIYEEVNNLISTYKPEVIIIEDTYLLMKSKARKIDGDSNVDTLKKLNQVRGVVMLAAAQREIPLMIYAATTAKKAVTGNGRSTKVQVRNAVMSLYKDTGILVNSKKINEDIADAIALCITDISKKAVEINGKKQ